MRQHAAVLATVALTRDRPAVDCGDRRACHNGGRGRHVGAERRRADRRDRHALDRDEAFARIDDWTSDMRPQARVGRGARVFMAD